MALSLGVIILSVLATLVMVGLVVLAIVLAAARRARTDSAAGAPPRGQAGRAGPTPPQRGA
jgi:uncharacterized iron-regulated membrane protein